PILPLAVGSQNERAFFCSNQYSHFTHSSLLYYVSDRFRQLALPFDWHGCKSLFCGFIESRQNRSVVARLPSPARLIQHRRPVLLHAIDYGARRTCFLVARAPDE